MLFRSHIRVDRLTTQAPAIIMFDHKTIFGLTFWHCTLKQALCIVHLLIAGYNRIHGSISLRSVAVYTSLILLFHKVDSTNVWHKLKTVWKVQVIINKCRYHEYIIRMRQLLCREGTLDLWSCLVVSADVFMGDGFLTASLFLFLFFQWRALNMADFPFLLSLVVWSLVAWFRVRT